jgi:flagellar biosynthetic protein FliO
MVWAVGKMILVLGAVLAVLLLLIWLCKQMAAGRGNIHSDGQIRILTTKPIAPRKYISLVGIGGQVLVLGISEAQITLLDKIENREFVEKIEAQHAVKPGPFSIFGYFSPGRKGPGREPLRILHGK